MRVVFTILLVAHGLIHLMGFAKAFGLAELTQLRAPISRPLGAAWLVAALLFLGAAVAYHAAPRAFWIVGGAAVVVSQIVIFTAFRDAKVGTVANLIALAGVVIGFAAHGPSSFRAEYAAQVGRGLSRAAPQPLLTEADVAALPDPVARYLRLTGSVGQPRVQSFRARFRGRIRGAADARWMDIEGEQTNFHDEPARLFFLDASMFGVPFEAFHRFTGSSATMRVKVASLIPMVDAKGPIMDRSETVTLFNDMCILAPATLIDPRIRWEAQDARSARATFTHAGQTIGAVLSFDEAGRLSDFWSDDRSQASSDGKSFTRRRWSTPVREYRSFGARSLATRGEGRWHAPEGEFDYLRFELVDITYNVDR